MGRCLSSSVLTGKTLANYIIPDIGTAISATMAVKYRPLGGISLYRVKLRSTNVGISKRTRLRQQPGIPSRRSSTGDMASGPGRSWCAHRPPSITAGRRRQPGAPAAGAAPVTWPSARCVPGEHPGAPRCAAGRRPHPSIELRKKTGHIAGFSKLVRI